MKTRSKTGILTLLALVIFFAADRAEGQIAVGEASQQDVADPGNLQSATERTMDWLNTEIQAPKEDIESASGIQLFSNPVASRSAIKTGAKLTLVISLFLIIIFVWRMLPKSNSRRKSSNEVLSVIAQIPFVQGQQLQLVRVGTRLLLVATSQSGSQTLSEIADPAEVLQIESAFRQGRMDQLTASLQKRASENASVANGVSLGSHQPVGRTLLEA